MLKEKQKFKNNPHNYALKKTDLLKKKDMAEAEGRDDDVKEIRSQLDDLEQRASELDRQRTANISSIKWDLFYTYWSFALLALAIFYWYMDFYSYINKRNREGNQKEIEEAYKREWDELRSQTADPFTRRQCRPTMVSGVSLQTVSLCQSAFRQKTPLWTRDLKSILIKLTGRKQTCWKRLKYVVFCLYN